MAKVVIKEPVATKSYSYKSGNDSGDDSEDENSIKFDIDWDEEKRKRYVEFKKNSAKRISVRTPDFEMNEEFLKGPQSFENQTYLEDNIVTMFDNSLTKTTWFSSYLIHLCEVIRSSRRKAAGYSKYLGNVPSSCTFDIMATNLTYECGNSIVDTIPLLKLFSQRYLNISEEGKLASFLDQEQDPFKVFDKVLDDEKFFQEMAFFHSLLKFEVHEAQVCETCHARKNLGFRKASHIVLEPKGKHPDVNDLIEDNEKSYGTCSNCQGQSSMETIIQGRPKYLTYRFEERSNVSFGEIVEIQGYNYEPIIVICQDESVGNKVGGYYTTIKRFDHWYRVESNRHPEEHQHVTNGFGMVAIVLKRIGEGLGQCQIESTKKKCKSKFQLFLLYICK